MTRLRLELAQAQYRRDLQTDPYNSSYAALGRDLVRCPKCLRLVKRRSLWATERIRGRGHKCQ